MASTRYNEHMFHETSVRWKSRLSSGNNNCLIALPITAKSPIPIFQ